MSYEISHLYFIVTFYSFYFVNKQRKAVNKNHTEINTDLPCSEAPRQQKRTWDYIMWLKTGWSVCILVASSCCDAFTMMILWLRVSRVTSCALCLNSWCCVFIIPAAVEGLRVWLVPLHPHRHPAPIRLLAPHHWKPDRHGSRQRYAARQPLHNIYTRFI